MAAKSFRKAVNAKCKDCIYDSCAKGTWREQVQMCTAIDCPLWEVRPQIKTLSEKQAKRLIFSMNTSRVAPDIIQKCLPQIRQFGP